MSLELFFKSFMKNTSVVNSCPDTNCRVHVAKQWYRRHGDRGLVVRRHCVTHVV